MNSEQQIIEDLSVPILSYRLHALEQAIQEGASQALLQALEGRLATEDNDECRTLLGHALTQVRRRQGQAAPVTAIPAGLSPSCDPSAVAVASLASPASSTPSSATAIPGATLSATAAQGQVASTPLTSSDSLAADFASLPATEQIDFLAQLRRPQAEKLVEQAKIWLATPLEAPVLALLLRIFAPLLPKDCFPTLETHLASPSFSVRSATLELLLRRDPQRLQDRLTGYLDSEDAGIRVIAIQALAKTDPDEALERCAQMLQDSSAIKRLAGLKAVALLPSAGVRELLLKFIVLEKKTELLKQAALILQFNPDRQLPYQLWEIIERSSGDKADLLKRSLRETCKNLQLSGQIEENEEKFFRRLQTWIKLRNLRNYLQGALQQADLGTGDPVKEIRQRLLHSAPPEMVKHVLGEAQTWPLGTQGQGFLRQLVTDVLSAVTTMTTAATPDTSGAATPAAGAPLATTAAPAGAAVPATVIATPPAAASATPPAAGTPSAAASAAAVQTTTTTTGPGTPEITTAAPPVASTDSEWLAFQNLAVNDQLQRLRHWPTDEKDRLTRVLQVVLMNRVEIADVLRAEALRAAFRHRIEGFFLVASEWLSSPTEELCAAAIEYIGWLDKDRVLYQLGKVLTDGDLRKKTTTIRILHSISPDQAVAAIRSMMTPDQRNQHDAALACLVHIDFCLVRSLLAAFLGQSINDQTFHKGLMYFRLNPDKENLAHLLRLEKVVTPIPGRAEAVRNVRQETEAFLLEEKLVDENELAAHNQEILERLQREQNRHRNLGAGTKAQDATSSGNIAQRLWRWLRKHLFITIFGLVYTIIAFPH